MTWLNSGLCSLELVVGLRGLKGLYQSNDSKVLQLDASNRSMPS